MCGRAYETYTEEELSFRYIRGTPAAGIFNLEPIFNLCPTMQSPVLHISNGRPTFTPMRWQLIPFGEPEFKTELSTINARSETLFTSELFKESAERRRGIIPLSGFYEWKRDGNSRRPFKIQLKDEPIMSVAGIWDVWRRGTPEEKYSFSIVTTSANSFMGEIHNRMPVILARKNEDEWLDPEVQEPQMLLPLLKPCPNDWLLAVEVSSLVNSPKNNSAELLTPLAERIDTQVRQKSLFELE